MMDDETRHCITASGRLQSDFWKACRAPNVTAWSDTLPHCSRCRHRQPHGATMHHVHIAFINFSITNETHGWWVGWPVTVIARAETTLSGATALTLRRLILRSVKAHTERPNWTDRSWTNTVWFVTDWPMGKQGEPIGHWLTCTWA